MYPFFSSPEHYVKEGLRYCWRLHENGVIDDSDVLSITSTLCGSLQDGTIADAVDRLESMGFFEFAAHAAP